jgi:hypothetical protein
MRAVTPDPNPKYLRRVVSEVKTEADHKFKIEGDPK